MLIAILSQAYWLSLTLIEPLSGENWEVQGSHIGASTHGAVVTAHRLQRNADINYIHSSYTPLDCVQLLLPKFEADLECEC